jgi:tRNA/rRNA methyltransferase/tRNA (cytidine32/uridine32-2'-O)-methyltransferase
MFEVLKKIRIVLVNTSHPGNIGAVARAMKTMGLSQLYLVDPQHYPSAEASARASGADDVLAAAVVCSTLLEAIGDCIGIIGTSARERRLEWPLLLPEQAAQQALGRTVDGDIALVFGRERFGLTNEELDCCDALMTIPANPEYSSLNLAAAVQILCYELRLQCLQAQAPIDAAPVADDERPASAAEFEGFQDHLAEILAEIGITGEDKPKQTLLRRLRRLYQRAGLTVTEVNILRGILTAIHRHRARSGDKITPNS